MKVSSQKSFDDDIESFDDRVFWERLRSQITGKNLESQEE